MECLPVFLKKGRKKDIKKRDLKEAIHTTSTILIHFLPQIPRDSKYGFFSSPQAINVIHHVYPQLTYAHHE